MFENKVHAYVITGVYLRITEDKIHNRIFLAKLDMSELSKPRTALDLNI
jgi:hypothetical protein